MTKPISPHTLRDVAAEESRLRTLWSYGLKECGSDPVLDQMTAMLAQVFRVPFCCVSLADESHVWFKSRYGLELERVPSSEDNLCVRTVRCGDLLVVRDLCADPEFRQNPWVCGNPGLRFYAAAPLLAPDGEAIGTICVMDTKPRAAFEDLDGMLLKSFAKTVMDHLELRKQSLDVQHLATSHRLLADAVNQTDDAIIITDTRWDGRGPTVVYVNAAFSRMMGYSPQEIIGNTPRILRGEKTDPGVLRRLEAALLGNQPFEGETVKYRKDGSALTVNWKVSPVRDKTGQVTNYISTYRDVTLERAAQRKLAKARDRADKASKAKSAFLAAMSHEIRTPLNGILGNAELLSQTALDSDQFETVTLIRKSGELLLNVVNDILDFSKVEAGKIQLEKIEFSLIDVLRDVVDLLGEAADRKSLELTLDIGDTVTDQVIGDPQRLRQVLLNVVSNAVKFTEQGAVAVHVAAKTQVDGLVEVTIHVADSGIGIAAESQRKLFEGFNQADSSMARRYGGTGLGLAISKRLLDCMHGSLTFSSELNVGSTFVITVPFKLPELASPVPDLQTIIREKRILVVSERRGWCSRTCRDVTPLSIPALLNDSAMIQNAALRILVDATAPGYDVEQLDALAARVSGDRILVLLPAFSRKRTRMLRQAGFGFIASTPLRAKDLSKWLEHASGTRAAFAPVETHAVVLNVLLVEDNPTNQRLATRMLQKLGCEVQLAENGRRAVEALEGGDFDLILMDCQMPELDGIEATRIIRRFGCSTPIVALTAHALSGDRGRCLSAGMNDYLTKPVCIQTLADAIAKWTRRGNSSSNTTIDAVRLSYG